MSEDLEQFDLHVQRTEQLNKKVERNLDAFIEETAAKQQPNEEDIEKLDGIVSDV